MEIRSSDCRTDCSFTTRGQSLIANVHTVANCSEIKICLLVSLSNSFSLCPFLVLFSGTHAKFLEILECNPFGNFCYH